MYSNLDCYSCVVKRATEAVKQAGLDEAQQSKIIRGILASLSDIDPSDGSSKMIQKAFQTIREIGNIHDPMENIKSYCMDIALQAYPELKSTLDRAENRFATAVRIAMAGNIIDHDREERPNNLALFKSIEDALSRPLAIDHIEHLKEDVKKANKILYVADNAAESVFDRILIEELPLEKIIYAVKGIPVSNDATLRDAEMAGLLDIVEVIEDESDHPCINLEKSSSQFQRVFEKSDLIIAKGQGNFRALQDMNIEKNIYSLVRIRCRVKAHLFKLSVGDFLVKGFRINGY